MNAFLGRTKLSRLAAFTALLAAVLLASCRANSPGAAETRLVDEIKRTSIGGKDRKNPLPDTPENAKLGAEHFQHHCMVCHGLDGHNTGVPFAEKMSPPVADLGSNEIQKYTDGQLKWIIQNGIRYTGMPGWQGILDDAEMWHVIAYLRHLPAKGSLGAPEIYKEEEEEHKAMHEGAKPGEKAGEKPAPSDQPHQHQHQHPPEHKH